MMMVMGLLGEGGKRNLSAKERERERERDSDGCGLKAVTKGRGTRAREEKRDDGERGSTDIANFGVEWDGIKSDNEDAKGNGSGSAAHADVADGGSCESMSCKCGIDEQQLLCESHCKER